MNSNFTDAVSEACRMVSVPVGPRGFPVRVTRVAPTVVPAGPILTATRCECGEVRIPPEPFRRSPGRGRTESVPQMHRSPPHFRLTDRPANFWLERRSHAATSRARIAVACRISRRTQRSRREARSATSREPIGTRRSRAMRPASASPSDLLGKLLIVAATTLQHVVNAFRRRLPEHVAAPGTGSRWSCGTSTRLAALTMRLTCPPRRSAAHLWRLANVYRTRVMPSGDRGIRGKLGCSPRGSLRWRYGKQEPSARSVHS